MKFFATALLAVGVIASQELMTEDNNNLKRLLEAHVEQALVNEPLRDLKATVAEGEKRLLSEDSADSDDSSGRRLSSASGASSGASSGGRRLSSASSASSGASSSGRRLSSSSGASSGASSDRMRRLSDGSGDSSGDSSSGRRLSEDEASSGDSA